MATANRFGLAVGVALLAGGPVTAQPAVAPPPRPGLNEVVKEYRRLGLPLPPPDAPLVRIALWHRDGEEQGRPPSQSYLLAFRLPPPWPGADPRYWVGEDHGADWSTRQWFDPRDVEPVEATAEALRGVSLGSSHYLGLAVASRLRGWDELADRLYALTGEVLTAQDDDRRLLHELRRWALGRWSMRAFDRGSDRAEVLRHLKALVEEDEDLANPQDGSLLGGLETTLGHPGSEPGSVDALIDGLTEYSEGEDDADNPTGREPYWRLAALGFAAVPALIDHLGDDRLTRTYHNALSSGLRPYPRTVGHIASRLLFDLSGGTVAGYDPRTGARLPPAEAVKWFGAAKKVGEERWLLDHAIPTDGAKPLPNQEGRPERLIARVIGAKYPDRLPGIYRAVLRNPPTPLLGDFVEEVTASKLAPGQKVALLMEGVATDDFAHRAWALQGLAKLDRARFREHLLLTLGWLRDRARAGRPGFDDCYPLVQLVERSGDPVGWRALLSVGQELPFGLRADVIREVGWTIPPDRPDPPRRERFRFLASFLDDRTAEAGDDADRKRYEVRDLAATQLAGRLGFPVHRSYAHLAEVNHDAGPLSRLILREVVRAAVNRELAGLGK